MVRSRIAPAVEREPEFTDKQVEIVIYGPYMDSVRANGFLRVIRIERGIDSAEDNRNIARGLPNEPNCLLHPGIPVRHDRGHENDIERHEGLQAGPEFMNSLAVSFIVARHRTEQVRFRDDLALIFADAVGVGLERISAVEKEKVGVKGAQMLCDFQQAERPGPEVKGREVVDPGVDEQDAGLHDMPVMILRLLS
jgi:hypothetical protein